MLALRAEGPGDPRDALRHAIGGDAGEGEPQAGLATLEHEVGAGDEGDALLLGGGEQRRRVGAGIEVEPQEVAAARDHELGLRDLLAEGLDQRVAPLGERPVDELDVLRSAPERQSSSTTDSASMLGEM